MQQPTLTELLEPQENDLKSIQTAATIGLPKSSFNFDSEDTVVRICSLDLKSQLHIQSEWQPCILHLRPHFLLEGHLDNKRMYDIMPQHFYRPHMNEDVYSKAAKCPWNHLSFKNERKWPLFPLASLLTCCLQRTGSLTVDQKWKQVCTRNSRHLF